MEQVQQLTSCWLEAIATELVMYRMISLPAQSAKLNLNMNCIVVLGGFIIITGGKVHINLYTVKPQ